MPFWPRGFSSNDLASLESYAQDGIFHQEYRFIGPEIGALRSSSIEALSIHSSQLGL